MAPLARLTRLVIVSLLAWIGAGTRLDAAEVEIERMTWIEVRDRIADGATTIIIPTGGTEQNGAHMVLGKHNFIVAETARLIARALGDALVRDHSGEAVAAHHADVAGLEVPGYGLERRGGHADVSLVARRAKAIVLRVARAGKRHCVSCLRPLTDRMSRVGAKIASNRGKLGS